MSLIATKATKSSLSKNKSVANTLGEESSGSTALHLGQPEDSGYWNPTVETPNFQPSPMKVLQDSTSGSSRTTGVAQLQALANHNTPLIQLKEGEGQAEESQPLAATSTSFIAVETGDPSGKMEKNQFLAALQAEVKVKADAVLSSVSMTVENCPYIEKWFSLYQKKSASEIEKAIFRFAPDTKSVTDVMAIIELVALKIKGALIENVKTGTLEQVPPEVKDVDSSKLQAVIQGAFKDSSSPLSGTVMEAEIAQFCFGDNNENNPVYNASDAAEAHFRQTNDPDDLEAWAEAVRAVVYQTRRADDRYVVDARHRMQGHRQRLAAEAAQRADGQQSFDAMNVNLDQMRHATDAGELGPIEAGAPGHAAVAAKDIMVESSAQVNAALVAASQGHFDAAQHLLTALNFSAFLQTIAPVVTTQESEAGTLPGGFYAIGDLQEHVAYPVPVFMFAGDGLVAGRFHLTLENVVMYEATQAGDVNQFGHPEENFIILPGTTLYYHGEQGGRLRFSSQDR